MNTAQRNSPFYFPQNKKVRQPKLTHRKRKLRLSLHKTGQMGMTNHHMLSVEFAVLQNSREQHMKRYSIPIKENTIPISFIRFCVAHLAYHNYLACCNSLTKIKK